MGLGLAVALGASNTLETLTVNQYFHMLYRVALHLKVCVCDMLATTQLVTVCVGAYIALVGTWPMCLHVRITCCSKVVAA